MKFDLDLFVEERKWVMPCDKCGQFTSQQSGGDCYTDWETGCIEGAICMKCKLKKKEFNETNRKK